MHCTWAQYKSSRFRSSLHPAHQAWGQADSREPEESLVEHLASYEKKLLVNTLTRCKGNHSEVARQLKIPPRTTLQSKLRKYSISS